MVEPNEPRTIQGYLTGPEIFKSVPNAAVTIVYVLGAGAAIEQSWATVLASLCGSEVDAAMVLLENLKTIHTQEAAIIQLAELKLNSENLQIIKIAQKAIRLHRERRNAFAHGIWAKPLGGDDQLVLIRPKHVKRRNANLTSYLVHGTMRGNGLETVIEERDFYRERDFEEAMYEAHQASQLMELVSNFVLALSMQKASPWAEALDADAIKSVLQANPAFRKASRGFRPISS